LLGLITRSAAMQYGSYPSDSLASCYAETIKHVDIVLSNVSLAIVIVF